jgi:translocation and assembly module TamB
MRRRLAHFLFVTLLGALALVLGMVTSMTATSPGRGLLARLVADQLGRTLRGEFQFGAISGSFVRSLTLTDVTIRDTSGGLLATLPSLDVTYNLPQLLAGQFVMRSVVLRNPTVHITKRRSGRMNYEEVLRLGEGAPGGRPPLVQFRNLHIYDGTIRISVPWSPSADIDSDAGRKELERERAKPGRMIENAPDGLRRIITVSKLTTRMPMVWASMPDRRPLTVDLDTLAGLLSDPAVPVRHIRGRIQVKGDSLIFAVESGALPNSQISGGGVLTWPEGPIWYDIGLDMPQLDLADIRWISPDFPDLAGPAVLAARTESPERTAFALRDMSLRGPAGGLDGVVTILQDKRRGLGVRDMRLRLEGLTLDAIRPYLDTLPLDGTLTGTVAGNGYQDQMAVELDWNFADYRLPEQPTSEIAGEGVIQLTGPNGVVFDSFTVHRSDLALETVRLLIPAVRLYGRLEATGALSGPWRNTTFLGHARHLDEDRPASELDGRVRFDSRGDILGLSVDVVLTPLSFDGIRRGFPALKSRGFLRGPVRLEGDLARVEVDANVRGDIGRVRMRGPATLLLPMWGGDSLAITFDSLNLAAVRGSGPPTTLRGNAVIQGVVDSAGQPEGSLIFALGPSSIREFVFDTASTSLAVRNGSLRLDSLNIGFPKGGLTGSGTVGWRHPETGTMTFAMGTDSLTVFDSLVTALGLERDSAAVASPLRGLLQGTLQVSGALDTLLVSGRYALTDVSRGTLSAPSIGGRLTWLGGRRPQLSMDIDADSLGMGRFEFKRFRAAVRGRSDSLHWAGGVQLGELSDVALGGRMTKRDTIAVWTLDSLAAQLARHRWELAAPAVLTEAGASSTLSEVEFHTSDGSGIIRASGALPSPSGGALAVEALGVEAQDVYGLLQRDTTAVDGSIGANLEIGGSRSAPTIRGTITMADVVLGDFRGPFAQGLVNYADQRLEANLLLWKTGEPVVEIEAQLPLDLAFAGVANRQLPGNLSVRALADSVDLGVFEAFTANVRNLRGTLDADARIAGSWDEPRLDGFVEVRDGRADIPSLGVRFNRIAGRALLAGDSVAIDSLRLKSGGGRLDVAGGLRLENLTRPILDLDLRADRFRAIDVRAFLTLTASGRLRLTGPVFQARLTGSTTATQGVLYFADLVTKQIIDLEDPANADLIDLSIIGERRLGTAFQNRFLDSLQIDDLELAVREDFWLRSNESNIQLEGSLRVNKVRKDYRWDGTLNAVRGTYTLKAQFVTRGFDVLRGTVRYFGTPDLNADLNIEAQHMVQPFDRSEEIPVIAKITGTLQVPKLTLESPIRPPISETDLFSYLMFGRPSYSLSETPQGNQSELFGSVLAYFSSALSSEIERTLISDLGVPIDFVEIRPGLGASTFGTSAQATQLAAGWQIGRSTFLTFNAGVCPSQNLLSYRRLGASLEYRFSRAWRTQLSLEPVQTCIATSQSDALGIPARYQVGFDLLWEREY